MAMPPCPDAFVAGAQQQANARAVLLATATFARQTGACVIAKGIEHGALLEFVHTIDDALPRETAATIRGGQGYGPGRPSPSMPTAGASLYEHAAAAAT
jgi:EAL domain-containing protein (putative c-di-GMP-specific phosphodiesterase class I)